MSGVPQSSAANSSDGVQLTAYEYKAPPVLTPDTAPQDYPPQGYFEAVQMGQYPVVAEPVYPNSADHQYPQDLSGSDVKRALSKFYEPRMITSNHDRRKFIIKVYALLSIQLAFTALMVGIVIGVKTLRDGIRKAYYVVFIALILMFILLILIFCGRKLAKTYPWNYIALASFTIFETYILAFICSNYSPLSVLAAAVMALGVTLALTVYAFKTKKDFTTMGGFITVLLVSILLFGFLMIFLYSVWSYILICLFGVILYGFYIVYDTQLIAGGRYGELTYDDYVAGALLLYIDVVGLFMYLLSLMGRKS